MSNQNFDYGNLNIPKIKKIFSQTSAVKVSNLFSKELCKRAYEYITANEQDIIKKFSNKKSFKIKIICIGNIFVGGTGKTSLAIEINKLLRISQSDNLESETIKQARLLEGTLRNTGIHACGVIITPDDIKNFVPIATAKDSDLFVTQFDLSLIHI